MCIYERIILFKRVHYFVYYHLVGIIIFLLEELSLRALGETSLLPIRLIVIYGGFTVFPIAAIYLSRRLRFILNKIRSSIVPPSINNYELWVSKKIDDFFSFKYWPIRISVLLIGTAVLVTILSMQKPFPTILPNIIVYISILPIVYVGSHGYYFVIAILHFLSRLVRYPINVPFFRIQSVEIKYIQNFYFRTSLLILLIYFYIVFTAWQSPFGFSEPVLFWLSILGFCPLAMFLWSFFQIHVLMSRIKQIYLDVCTEKIQIAIKELDKKMTTSGVDKLLKLMEVQGKVEKLPEWPVNINSTVTFIITLTLPALNLVLDVYKK